MKWTKEKLETLARMWPDHSAEEIAQAVGATVGAVLQKRYVLSLKKKGPVNKVVLTRTQQAWLKANFGCVSNDICASILGISSEAVKRRAHELGLSKTKEFMAQAQAFAARKARESNERNGTYPPKGWYSPNLQKGEAYQFRKKNKVS